MDWYELEYLFPKAFQRFKESMFPHTGLPSLNTLSSYDIKKLYHFFDKEGVYLIVERIKSTIWVYTITTNDIVNNIYYNKNIHNDIGGKMYMDINFIENYINFC